MAGDIKRRIVLEGEKEYNSALKDIQRNLKTMRSELKAESAELGKNATDQQKAEARARSAAAQIKEQEKAVKILEEALGKAKEEYADNEEVIAKWQQKLNEARTTLAQMRDGLYDMGDGFRQSKSDAELTAIAAKQVGDALNQIGSVGDNVAGAIENIFFGCIDVLKAAVSDLWELVNESAAKANNWSDIAGYWNTDAQTIQQYARAVSASANSFEDLNTAVTKLVLGGKEDKITELLGISKVNYKNDWDYAMAAMNEIYEMTQRGQNMDLVWEEIFGGKAATKVMDLVNDWAEIRSNLEVFNGNESGYGMNDQMLTTMNDLYVNINRIEEKWEALKDRVAGGLGNASMDLLVNVEGSLDAIADFMNAETPEEREQALADLRENVEEFFRKVGEIIQEAIGILHDVGEELQTSGDPLTRMIGDILVKLTDALQWMIDNQEAVKAAFEAIFGVWLIAKLAAVAGKLSSILMQIEAIKAFKGLSLGSGAAQAAGSAASGGLLSGIGGFLGSTVKFLGGKALPVLGGAALGLSIGNAIDGQGFTPIAHTADDSYYDENGNATKWARAEGLPDTWDEYQSMLEENPFGIPEEYKKEKIAETRTQRLATNAAEIEANAAEREQMLQNFVKHLSGEGYWGTMFDREGMYQEVLKHFLGDEHTDVAAVFRELEHAKNTGATQEALDASILPLMQKYGLAPAQKSDGSTAGVRALSAAIGAAGNGTATIEWLADQLRQAGENKGNADFLMNQLDILTRERLEAMIEDYRTGGRVDQNDFSEIVNAIWAELGDAILDRAAEAPEEPTRGQSVTQAQRDAAEAFWDAYKAAEGNANEEAASAAFDVLWELYADQIDVLEALAQKIDDLYMDENGRTMEDLPPSWFTDAAAWQNAGGSNGVTSSDLANFRSLPGSLAAAVKSGAAAGVSGIRVYMDGAEVGRLVAPYVSEEVARDILV